eukprot:TRINITY_DN5569_c0_g1_i1.p1 TRINITY_DN5569_c0_g1~~TRINITY_DN5569_c0_g1_i1.p1  ORF type:complete len:1392 (-),score=287.03 TRINITY_DN5569_c0_g1_i1:207-4337(-)
MFAPVDVKKWIEERFVPVVMVSTTPEVDATCKTHSLTFADLLRPYQRLSKEVHTRTIKEDGAYAIKTFSIRLRTVHDICNMPEDRRYQYFGDVVRKSLETNPNGNLEGLLKTIVDAPLGTQCSLDGEQQGQIRNIGTPWFETFRQEFTWSCRFNYWSTLDHPVGVILAVSTASPDVKHAFEQLYTTATTQLFQLYGVDNNVFKYFVLVHDAASGIPMGQVEKLFNDVKAEYGVMVSKLIILNSDLSVPAQMWDNLRVPIDEYCASEAPQIVPQLGPVHLTGDEVAKLQALMTDYIALGLLPFMERKVRQLHQLVTAKKQGKMTKLLNMFTGKADQGEASATQNKFNFDSYEMQMRRISDLLFLLRDYNQASNFYKQLKTELTSTTPMPAMNYPYVASCLEATGLCLWLQGRGNTKDTDTSFEQAYLAYLKCHRADYALRVSLFLYALLKARQTGSRGSDIIIRCASIDEKRVLYNALCLEQAALIFLSSPSLYFRKFAFYMVQAGLKYAQSDQAAQAIRCNRLALAVYGSKQWRQMDDHLNSQLGKLHEERGKQNESASDMLKGIKYTRRFIRRCSQPTAKQTVLLTHFCELLNSYLAISGKSVFNNFHLPVISARRLQILINRYGHYGTTPNLTIETEPIAAEPDEELWRTMHLSAAMGKCLHPMYSSSGPTLALVGERVVVQVGVTNPLNIPITIQDITLQLRFAPPPPPPGEGAAAEGQAAVGEEYSAEAFANTSLDVLQLNANEHKEVMLSFTPLRPGDVEVRGMEWTLCGIVRGRKHFDRRATELDEVEDDDKTDDELAAPASSMQADTPSLVVSVVAAMPCLAVEFDPPPRSHLMDGEICRTYLALHNSGASPMENISVTYSHPAMITFAPLAEPFLLSSGKPLSASASASQQQPKCETLSLKGLVIAPGTTARVLAFVRGCSVGAHVLCLNVLYSDSNSVYRVHRSCLKLNVSDALQLRAFCLPVSPLVTAADPAPANMSLALEICNTRRDTKRMGAGGQPPPPHFTILQLTSLARHWDVNLVEPDRVAARSASTVPPAQVTALFFKLQRTTEERRVERSATVCAVDEYAIDHTHFLSHVPEGSSAASSPADSRVRQALEGLLQLRKGDDEWRPAGGSAVASAITGNAIDTRLWPINYFTFNASASPTPVFVSQSDAAAAQAATVQQGTSNAGGPQGGGNDLPLAFLCFWAVQSEGGDVTFGQTHIVCLPYQWCKGWTKTVIPFPLVLGEFFTQQQSAVVAKPVPTAQGSRALKQTTRFTVAVQSPAQLAATRLPVEQELQLTITNHTSQKVDLLLLLKSSAPAFLWVGKTKRKLVDLEPGASVSAQLRVVFLMNGTHDLNSFQLLDAASLESVLDSSQLHHYHCTVAC